MTSVSARDHRPLQQTSAAAPTPHCLGPWLGWCFCRTAQNSSSTAPAVPAVCLICSEVAVQLRESASFLNYSEDVFLVSFYSSLCLNMPGCFGCWTTKHTMTARIDMTATGCLLQLGFSQSPPLILQKITSLNPISKLQKSYRLQIVCWHIFLSKLLKSRTIINSLCKAFCLVTGSTIARHKMTNIYFAWFHLRLYSRPTKIGVNQELHLRVVPVSAGTKTTGYLTLQDPKPLQEAWQCPTCLPQHWQEEIPWTSELLFSGLRLVVMVYALAWELRGRLLRSIHWVEVGYACLHGKQVPIRQRWWKNKFRKECLKLKKAWLNALGLAFLFGIVQYRESCDKHHGRRCQFTRNTKPRFASFVSIFPRIPLRNTPAARHASQKHTRPAGNISVHAMGPLKQSHGLGIKQLIDAGHL